MAGCAAALLRCCVLLNRHNLEGSPSQVLGSGVHCNLPVYKAEHSQARRDGRSNLSVGGVPRLPLWSARPIQPSAIQYNAAQPKPDGRPPVCLCVCV